ncbi:uncharacterized protein [Maniola hyperantus]|uniref:uncharacterized protein n=1 Tax=Aphantopus hyperantus TaxID=2795564 RepID=UPI003749A9C1
MSGKYNFLILCNIQFIVFVIVIIAQFSQVQAKGLPMMFSENEPVVLLSWEDYDSPIAAPAIPDACKQSDICDNVKNYPTKLVENIMDKLRLKNITSFTNDQLYDNEYSNHLGEIEDLCETQRERIIFPLAVKDRYRKWQFILNMQGHRFQSFRVHECLDVPKVTCSKVAYITNSDFSLECEQQFTKREMVYLNLDSKVVQTGYFSVPSCCTCHLEPS